jgi:hypothetical protein
MHELRSVRQFSELAKRPLCGGWTDTMRQTDVIQLSDPEACLVYESTTG